MYIQYLINMSLLTSFVTLLDNIQDRFNTQNAISLYYLCVYVFRTSVYNFRLALKALLLNLHMYIVHVQDPMISSILFQLRNVGCRKWVLKSHISISTLQKLKKSIMILEHFS